MPTDSCNSSFSEESRYIAVISPPGFINQENETRCYFNETIQLLYFNVLFILLILNVDCDTMMTYLDKNNKNISYHYHNIMIVKELQGKSGEMYLESKTFSSDNFFTVNNIRIYLSDGRS